VTVTALDALRPSDVAPEYASPYALRFDTPAADRLAGLDAWPWNDPGAQADVPEADWYGRATRDRRGSWGPVARRYPAPTAALTAETARERVLSVAGALIGLDYQHHHVPAWTPPAGWPWKEVRSGRHGAGLDCSNFTGFAYDYALGLRFSTDVATQARTHLLPADDPHAVPGIRVVRGDYDELSAALKPADLVFIAAETGAIVHVVLWLGACGAGPNATPLILDCGGPGRADANRVAIPAGVRIRPYRRTGWYARATAHAYRVIPD
jgi:cell wall-associated NlpC family hydrolase